MITAINLLSRLTEAVTLHGDLPVKMVGAVNLSEVAGIAINTDENEVPVELVLCDGPVLMQFRSLKGEAHTLH
ncbi:hypothetical protein [Bdellovibrio bacteriovorus]|uniref:hypothetical protein n=1 Tax=Bdellovibrio bacteriovorus TaxID=959 RepID=UPI003AA88580